MSKRNKLKANTEEETNRVTDLQGYIRQRDDESYRFLLHSEEGRWFLARLMKAEGLNASAFTGNSATFYNEGRRAVVIGIRDKIEALGKSELSLLHEAELELYNVEHYIFEEMKEDD